MSATTLPTLPRGGGVGLKPEHFRTILDTRPAIGFFEIHAENYMVAGGPFHHSLERIRAAYPLSIHGVGLSIGGAGPLDEAHLDRLTLLLEFVQPDRPEGVFNAFFYFLFPELSEFEGECYFLEGGERENLVVGVLEDVCDARAHFLHAFLRHILPFD